MTKCKILLLSCLLSTFAVASNKEKYGERCAHTLFQQSMSTGRALNRRAFLGTVGLVMAYGGYRGYRYLNYQPIVRTLHTAQEAIDTKSADLDNRLIFATTAYDNLESEDQYAQYNVTTGLSLLRPFQGREYIGAVPAGSVVTTHIAMMGRVLAEDGQDEVSRDGVFLSIGQSAQSRPKDFEILKSAFARIEQPGYFEKNFPRHPGLTKVQAFLKPVRSLLLREDLNLSATLQLEITPDSDELKLTGSLETLVNQLNTITEGLKTVKTIDDGSFYLIMAAFSKAWADELRSRKIEGPLTDVAATLSPFFMKPITIESAAKLLQDSVAATRANLKMHLAAALVEASKNKQDVVILAFEYKRDEIQKILAEIYAE